MGYTLRVVVDAALPGLEVSQQLRGALVALGCVGREALRHNVTHYLRDLEDRGEHVMCDRRVPRITKNKMPPAFVGYSRLRSR